MEGSKTHMEIACFCAICERYSREVNKVENQFEMKKGTHVSGKILIVNVEFMLYNFLFKQLKLSISVSYYYTQYFQM